MRVDDNEKKVLLDFHQAVVDVHDDVDEGVEQGAETLVSAWNQTNQTIEPVFRVSRCDISLSMQFMNNRFYNPDPPRKTNNKIPAPLAPKLLESILL